MPLKVNFFVLLLSTSFFYSSLAVGQHPDHETTQTNETSKKSNMQNMEMDRKAQMAALITRPSDCSEMEVYDVTKGMCMPLSMGGIPMTMLMVHGNGFLTAITESGPRGKSMITSPNMFMADIGTTVSGRHYINLDVMGAFEKWTFPDSGYPELLQIGEENNQGVPYLDAQHPHSSPIMGLTLSDTISFVDEKNHIKLFIAPRSEATDGPVAFMHRPTGMVNPDAPLGHHIGQDVGHITSTVIGESLKIGNTSFQFSTYHGAEPKPQNVDLPLGSLDSYSLRLIEEVSPTFFAMASYAYVSNPEPSEPSITLENRYSASIYNMVSLSNRWTFDNALIYGAVSNYDHATLLNSFAEEFLFMGNAPRIWGRIEALQRTPAELQITTSSDPNVGKWLAAVTLGYTYRVASWESSELGVGASVATDILPQDFQNVYGGNPWSGKLFLQIGGMKMWNL